MMKMTNPRIVKIIPMKIMRAMDTVIQNSLKMNTKLLFKSQKDTEAVNAKKTAGRDGHHSSSKLPKYTISVLLFSFVVVVVVCDHNPREI